MHRHAVWDWNQTRAIKVNNDQGSRAKTFTLRSYPERLPDVRYIEVSVDKHILIREKNRVWAKNAIQVLEQRTGSLNECLADKWGNNEARLEEFIMHNFNLNASPCIIVLTDQQHFSTDPVLYRAYLSFLLLHHPISSRGILLWDSVGKHHCLEIQNKQLREREREKRGRLEENKRDALWQMKAFNVFIIMWYF